LRVSGWNICVFIGFARRIWVIFLKFQEFSYLCITTPGIYFISITWKNINGLFWQILTSLILSVMLSPEQVRFIPENLICYSVHAGNFRNGTYCFQPCWKLLWIQFNIYNRWSNKCRNLSKKIYIVSVNRQNFFPEDINKFGAPWPVKKKILIWK